MYVEETDDFTSIYQSVRVMPDVKRYLPLQTEHNFTTRYLRVSRSGVIVIIEMDIM